MGKYDEEKIYIIGEVTVNCMQIGGKQMMIKKKRKVKNFSSDILKWRELLVMSSPEQGKMKAHAQVENLALDRNIENFSKWLVVNCLSRVPPISYKALEGRGHVCLINYCMPIAPHGLARVETQHVAVEKKWIDRWNIGR